jgi:hypothetical protein
MGGFTDSATAQRLTDSRFASFAGVKRAAFSPRPDPSKTKKGPIVMSAGQEIGLAPPTRCCRSYAETHQREADV